MGKAVGGVARLLLCLAAGSSLGAQVTQPATVGKHGRVVQSLAGEWRVRLDPRGVGEGEGWFETELEGRTMALPGTTDLAGIGYPLDPETMRFPVEFLDSEWPGRAAVARADAAGHLVRRHMYLGKAWYQRSILVPDDWGDRRVELFLERVLWGTQVWIDERLVGAGDSLVAPHRFDLGRLEPGPHRLTVCVDNGLVHPIGIIGHAYGPETQSRWNGIVGRIELISRPPLYLDDLQVFPADDGRSVRVVTRARGSTDPAHHARLRFTLREVDDDREVATSEVETPVRGGQRIEHGVSVDVPLRPWSEFDPHRYVLVAELEGPVGYDVVRTPFGFRAVRRAGRRVLVNGAPIFLRGTLDCAVYPRTGHPPTTVEEWLRVLGTIRDHGFNHVRFHTWCPPEAAFEAADRLGLYLAPETPFWVDDWTARIGLKPGVLGADEAVTEYLRNEIRRISDAYGNHPSFAFFCIGNEFGMSSDWELIDEVLRAAKEHDPRRLYSATTARRTVPGDDFWVTHRTGHAVRGLGPNHTDWDFAAGVADADLPVVAHETGQRPVFPDYEDLLGRFTGPLLPANCARLRDKLIQAGLADQVPDFERASALFQNVQYKAEHEAFHRTPGLAGYQLLMLNDFTGQSEALVGILDPFWESKGIVSAAEVRRWNAPTVVLARIDRFTWSSDEDFTATLEVSHFGPRDLASVSAAWVLAAADGSFRTAGVLPAVSVPRGGITRLGEVRVPLADISRATQLHFRVTLGAAANVWKIWGYPPAAAEPDTSVLIAADFDDATQRALAAGRSVLLLAHGAENPFAKRTGFASVYWSAGWWGDAFSSLGILCDPRHPALGSFPNEGHSDWQWYELTQGATTFRLDGAPPGFRPIVQPVTDFHHARLLGHVLEGRVGPGRLLVSGYDLARDLPTRHAARQLRRSLLAYMESEAFQPAHELEPALLARWLSRPLPAPAIDLDPETLLSAPLHVRAAGHILDSSVSAPWSALSDEILRQEPPYSWSVRGGTWMDAQGAAWHGNPLGVTVQIPPGTAGTLYVHLHDWNHLGRCGTLTVEDRVFTLSAHAGSGTWLAFSVAKEDAADGHVELLARPSAGPNLMITELAFLPRK